MIDWILDTLWSYKWILLVLFIVMSFTLNFRYASLGTNLIDFSFNDYSNIKEYDFILKI